MEPAGAMGVPGLDTTAAVEETVKLSKRVGEFESLSELTRRFSAARYQSFMDS